MFLLHLQLLLEGKITSLSPLMLQSALNQPGDADLDSEEGSGDFYSDDEDYYDEYYHYDEDSGEDFTELPPSLRKQQEEERRRLQEMEETHWKIKEEYERKRKLEKDNGSTDIDIEFDEDNGVNTIKSEAPRKPVSGSDGLRPDARGLVLAALALVAAAAIRK